MEEYPKDNEKQEGHVNEPDAEYANREAIELERLKKHVYMSDMEKLKLFCRMLRIGKMLSSAKITHHP